MNKLKMKNIISLFFSLCLFTSCELSFNEPVKEFLKEYTETAAIVSFDYDRSDYPVDKNGFTSIDSSNDVIITYTMRNPQRYALNFDLNFIDENTKQISNRFGKNAYSFTQTKDYVQVVLKYSQDFLYSLECGGNLTGAVTVREPKTDRTFDSYNYKLKVNSIPEPVRNLVVLQDTADRKYVLAMNMPDMSGIHKDIKVLRINNVDYPVVLSNNPTVLDSGINTELYNQFKTVPNESWIPGSMGISFEGNNEKRILYFKTDKDISTEEFFFDVILEDAEGLAIESKVSAQSKKLNKVVFSEGFNSLDTNDEGYANFTITAPATATDGSPVDGDIKVYYKIYSYDESAPDKKGEVVKQGSGNNSIQVTLTTGKWICESWSHKIGYIDSTVKNDLTYVQGFVFVQPSYAGEVKDGGRTTPYTSIEQAISSVIGFDTVKIILLEDVNLAAPLTLTTNLEIRADNVYKVNGNITIPRNYSVVINGKATFEYLTVNQGGFIKTRNIAPGTNVIAKVECVPLVAGSPLAGIEVIKSADGDEVTEEITERFNLQNRGYYIKPQGDKGVINIAGITIEVQTILGNYTVKVTGITDNANGSKSASVGTKLIVAEIKDVNGQIVSLDAVTAMNILTEGTVVQTNSAASKKTELTIANYAYSGAYNYILEVCFTVGGMPVSAQIPFYLK